MLRVHRVKAEEPGLSSMSPERRTNKLRKRLRTRRVRDRVNNNWHRYGVLILEPG